VITKKTLMEIPSIHSTQLYSQAALVRRPGIKSIENQPPKTARDTVNISTEAHNRWKALDTLNSLLDLGKSDVSVLSLHSAQALGEMLKALASRGVIGFEAGTIGNESGTRYAGTIVGLTT
jgi:hypothetical protein